MKKAIEKVNQTILRHKTNDPELILKNLGVDVLDVPLDGVLKELYFTDHIVLKAGLPESERRQLLAHALCHHLMHKGNHLLAKRQSYSFGNYHEKQADVFAAYLLMPESEIEKVGDSLSADTLAQRFDVLKEFAEFRIELAKHHSPKKYISSLT